jgi:hypothetical protein
MGLLEGTPLGDPEGLYDGDSLGKILGATEGTIGLNDGDKLGVTNGASLGIVLGDSDLQFG